MHLKADLDERSQAWALKSKLVEVVLLVGGALLVQHLLSHNLCFLVLIRGRFSSATFA